MPRNKSNAMVSLAFLFAASFSAFAVDENSPAIKTPQELPPKMERDTTVNVPLRPDMADKKIFIELKNSPKGSKVFQEKLAAKGFRVVGTKEESDASFVVLANFHISGAGKETLEGPIADLFEAKTDTSAADSPDFTHQNINVGQIAASTIPLGGVSISQVAVWISQKIGVAGRFNEMLTGDPRGWCWGGHCNQRSNIAYVNIRGGDNGRWWGYVKAVDQRLLVDFVINEAIEDSLKPFYDLKAASGVKLSQDKQVASGVGE